MTISVCEFLKSRTDFRGRILATVAALGVATAVWAGDPVKSAAPTEGSKLPFKQQADNDANVMARVVGGLVLVILLGYGAVYAVRRYLPSVYAHTTTGQRKINVIETRRLTPKTTLFLVEVDGVRLLLAQSGDRLESLLQMSDRDTTGRDGVEVARE